MLARQEQVLGMCIQPNQLPPGQLFWAAYIHSHHDQAVKTCSRNMSGTML